MFRILLSVLIILLTVVATSAQDGEDRTAGDPRTDPTANACYTGGAMEGVCGTMDSNGDGVVDAAERDWHWTCGWHLSRLQAGLISYEQFPDRCEDLLVSDLCVAIGDEFNVNVAAPFANVPGPGVLANDSCTQIVSHTAPVVVQGGGIFIFNLNADGGFNYTVTDDCTIFTFTYTTEDGATATVTVNHDIAFCE